MANIYDKNTFNVIDGHLTNVNYLDKSFDCSERDLTTLDGCPKEVIGGFYCHHNNLTNLEGGPEKVKGYYDCSNSKLTSLKGSPKVVGGNFYCYGNKLTTLEGSPEEVGSDFNCSGNKITNLKGCPKKVENFDCAFNDNLEDISDLPTTVVRLYINGCHNIKVFPEHVCAEFQIFNITKEVYRRLKKQPHLEIIQEFSLGDDRHSLIIIKEKPANEVFLEAI